eukprot:TCONS_00038337-protein
MGSYEYPATFEEFRKSLVSAYEKGKKEGIETYRKSCPEGIAFIESNAKLKDFSFLQCTKDIPEENQFKGFVSDGYSLRMLRDVKPSDFLSEKTNQKEKKISEFFVGQKDEKGFELLDELEEENIEVKIEKKDEELCTEEFAKSDSDKWYISRLIGEKMTKIHVRAALKILTPREHVSRERSRRHIASNYLPGKGVIDANHNIIAYRFVIANVKDQILVCKVASIMKNGTSIPSASSEDEAVKCRLIPLKETIIGSFIFEFPESLIVTKELKASHVLEEIILKPVNDDKKSFQMLPQFKKHLADHRKELEKSKDFTFAKEISKSLAPLEYQEVESVIERKLDPKSHEYLYHCKFKDSSLTAWLTYSCFDRPVRYNKRSGLEHPLFADVSQMNQDDVGKGKRQISIESSILTKPQKIKKSENVKSEIIPLETKSTIDQKVRKSVKRSISENETIDLTSSEKNKKMKLSSRGRAAKKLSIFQNLKLPSSRSSWLSDEILMKAFEIIRKQFPNLLGLQDPIFGSKISKVSEKNNLKEVSVHDKSIQIHHVRDNHWVLSTGRNGKVFVYDSIYSQTDDSLKRQLCQVYKYFIEDGNLHVSFPKVLRQKGSTDCGLFCLAYATDIACGVLPDNECYLQDKFRKHLLSCLESNNIERFPRDNIENENAVFKAESTELIPVFCDCQLPATNKMVKCYYCNEAFHTGCLANTENVNEEHFECHRCKAFAF